MQEGTRILILSAINEQRSREPRLKEVHTLSTSDLIATKNIAETDVFDIDALSVERRHYSYLRTPSAALLATTGPTTPIQGWGTPGTISSSPTTRLGPSSYQAIGNPSGFMS
jgi:hypothetical protein